MCALVITRWGRRGGSNSDSESPGVDDTAEGIQTQFGKQQPISADYSTGGGGPSFAGGNGGGNYDNKHSASSHMFQSRFHTSAADQANQLHHGVSVTNSTPSPQLSLAEFLQNE